MNSYLTTVILGIVCIIIGISNMKGNLSTIHSYHRKRLAAEDMIPFGKGVGLGTVIAGGSLVIYSILCLVSEKFDTEILLLASTVVLIIGVVLGLGISLYTIIKYNKGLF